MRQRPNEKDSSFTLRKRCTEKTDGPRDTEQRPATPWKRESESQPKQTMEVSQETQIHSGDRAKATAEGHKGKSPKKKNGNLITTRPELGLKGDPVAKEILRSDRVRGLSETETRPKGQPRCEGNPEIRTSQKAPPKTRLY